MRNNSNSLFNVNKGTTCIELWNKEFCIIKDISCLYLVFIRSIRSNKQLDKGILRKMHSQGLLNKPKTEHGGKSWETFSAEF